MRLENRRGPFTTLDVFFESVSPEEIRNLCRKYARVTILAHHPVAGTQGFRLRQKKTPNIYVTDGLDAVFSRFRDTVRNEIHRTERIEGFEIRLPDTADETYQMYRSFEFAQGRAPISRSAFARFVCAAAYLNDQPISGITFFQSGDIIRIRSIFSRRLNAKEMEDTEMYKTIGFASKRLIYEICRYGIEHGATLVDLASINLTDPDKEPIARFKSGFGAVIEDEYQYIWVSPIFSLAEKCAAAWSRIRVLFRR